MSFGWEEYVYLAERSVISANIILNILRIK